MRVAIEGIRAWLVLIILLVLGLVFGVVLFGLAVWLIPIIILVIIVGYVFRLLGKIRSQVEPKRKAQNDVGTIDTTAREKK